MHRTRTTVKLLVAVAVTALSGCVSVQPRPSAPPTPAADRPAQDLAPQIGRPPVRDTLEAVPAPEPSPATPGTASATPAAARPAVPQAVPRAPRPRHHHGPAHPRPRRAVPAVPVPVLPAPVTGKDVCALGRGYGHWPAGSAQSRICDHTYGH
ncbi:hypothetical protein EES39_31420 [Streptomyces sp. ADI92-24]|uniref:hypothetical protein n=1 Tax=Streptomyces sp. ADI92-24 TaxID=1522756 RepID=UPI000FBD5BA5|nr:hypothetical protein [Streptomyces sp. ADI92-24]RPK36658.1 hypothetical protein EES39_31420 [Streptomyces sp. ADI92-24]